MTAVARPVEVDAIYQHRHLSHGPLLTIQVEKAVDVAFEKVEEQWFRHKHPSLPVPSAEPPVSKRDL